MYYARFTKEKNQKGPSYQMLEKL